MGAERKTGISLKIRALVRKCKAATFPRVMCVEYVEWQRPVLLARGGSLRLMWRARAVTVWET